MHKLVARPAQVNSVRPAKARSQTGTQTSRQMRNAPDHARWQVGGRDTPQEAQAHQAADRVANGAHNVAASLPTQTTPANEGQQEAKLQRQAQARSLSAPPDDSSSGRPLDRQLGNTMTQAFGRPIEHVRVHDDTNAAKDARRLSAKAYTAGSHIYFAEGQFRPDTRDGVRLLAHEVSHTLQTPQQNVIRCAPDDEVVQQIIIYTDINQAIVVTDKGRHLYNLTDKTGLIAGDYTWEHEQGEVIDKKRGDGKSKLLSQPAGAGAGKQKMIDWRIAPTTPGQKSWGEYADSTFTMQVFDSADLSGGNAKGKAGQGNAAGQGGNKGSGSGTGGQPKPTATDADKEKKADEFMAALKAQGVGTGAPVSRDKVKELVGDMPADAMKDFFELFDQIQKKDPSSKTIEELLAYYSKLTPSQREVLRVNKVMAESLDETATSELPADVQLAIETKANETGQVASQLEGTNKSLAAIHAKVNAVDPDLAKNFEPLDPQKLTAFNQMLMLEGLLAGASQRSPAIEAVSQELMGNIGKIRGFIIEELVWLAAEMAATTVISLLLAPVSAGASTFAGAAAAGVLILRINQLRKILDTVMKIKAAIDVAEKVKQVIADLQKLNDLYTKFQQYSGEFDRLLALKKKLLDPNADASLHDQVDDLEDELLARIMEQIAADDGLGQILEYFYLPEDADEEELRRILLDIPRGIEAFKEMAAFYGKMQSGDLEDTKILTFKAFTAGYLLYPVTGYVASMANDQLGAILTPKSVGDRLFGMITSGGSGRGKGKGKTANRDRLKTVRTNKAKKKNKPKPPPEPKKPDPAADKKDKQPDKPKDDADAVKKKDEDDPTKKKKKDDDDEEETTDATSTGQDKAWIKLKRKLDDLPGEFSAGAAQDDVLKRAREIKGKLKYKKVAGGATIVTDSSKPGRWRLTVKRLDNPIMSIDVLVLKTDRTRYQEIRAKIKSVFDTVDDANRTLDYVQKTITDLKASYEYPHVSVKEKKGDGDVVVGWEINGSLPGKPDTEIITVDAPGTGWGSRHQPILMEYPKPAAAGYADVAIGPFVDEGVKIPQADLQTFAAKLPQAKTDFVTDLKKKSPGTTADIDQWVTDGMPIANYSPTSQMALPYSSKSNIGLSSTYQTKIGYKFQLQPQGSTPGGSKILNPLKRFGFSAQTEHMAGDHVLEYQLGGIDDRENLWPLDETTNSAAGNTVKNMLFSKPGGSGVVKMSELKDKARKPGKQNEVWFKLAKTL